MALRTSGNLAKRSYGQKARMHFQKGAGAWRKKMEAEKHVS